MRKNFGAKPLTYPQPVYIIATYGEDGTPDAMNAAWGGISEQNEISLCLSAGHKTVKNILKRGAFTVSMAETGHITACDYVGLVSGNNTPDKFTKAGFHAVMSEFVDAPLIETVRSGGMPPEGLQSRDLHPARRDSQRQRGRESPHPRGQGGSRKGLPRHLRPVQQHLPESR